MSSKSRVLLIGSGAVGTIGAYNLESGGEAEVTAVCRSNFKIVVESGLTIDSCDHGKVNGWRPTEGMSKSLDFYASLVLISCIRSAEQYPKYQRDGGTTIRFPSVFHEEYCRCITNSC